jgi:hypothetical protein
MLFVEFLIYLLNYDNVKQNLSIKQSDAYSILASLFVCLFKQYDDPCYQKHSID